MQPVATTLISTIQMRKLRVEAKLDTEPRSLAPEPGLSVAAYPCFAVFIHSTLFPAVARTPLQMAGLYHGAKLYVEALDSRRKRSLGC